MFKLVSVALDGNKIRAVKVIASMVQQLKKKKFSKQPTVSIMVESIKVRSLCVKCTVHLITFERKRKTSQFFFYFLLFYIYIKKKNSFMKWKQ